MKRLIALIASVLLVTGLVACEPSAPTKGIWLSADEVKALPTSGQAWDRVNAAANGNWGSVNLGDNNSLHDTYTLAGALVGVRTGNTTLISKTRAAVMSTLNSGYARVLELARNITCYVIAADLVGLPASDESKFKTYLTGLLTKPLSGHSGGTNLITTAELSANNWGDMSRAAVAAIAVYTGNQSALDRVANAQKEFLGEITSQHLNYTSTNWHTLPLHGINASGATISGHSVDGVIPEDQRRTGEFAWPAPKGSYPWEGMQGALVAGVILQRAGKVNINDGNFALRRAYNWLFNVNQNPASGDDAYQAWVFNEVTGTSFPTIAVSSPGKNMGWTDWTHR